MYKACITILISMCITGCQQQAPKQPKQKIDNFFISTMSAPIGWEIKESQGIYCRFFTYSGTGDYVTRFNDALKDISEEGKKVGANAFLNTKLSSESHEIQGSKWYSSTVNLCGDFVILK